MHRYFGSLLELLGSGSRQQFAVYGRLLIGMRCDNRFGFDQVVDHIGSFLGSGGERITNIHDRQLYAVVVPDDGFLFRGDPGVSGEIDLEPVRKRHDLTGRWSGISGKTRLAEQGAQRAADHGAGYSIGVRRGHCRQGNAIDASGCTETYKL